MNVHVLYARKQFSEPLAAPILGTAYAFQQQVRATAEACALEPAYNNFSWPVTGSCQSGSFFALDELVCCFV
jgi:hypothetical protein